MGPAPVISTSCVFADAACDDAYRTGSCDDDVFTYKVPSESSVGGVSEGVEEGNHFLVDSVRNGNHVIGRDYQIFGKGAVTVDAHTFCILAPLAVAGPAVPAVTADDVSFTGYELADSVLCDTWPKTGNFAYILMADNDRRSDVLLAPGIPVVNMHIGTADCGFVHFDQHLTHSRPGNRHFFEYQALAGFCFDKGIHHGFHAHLLTDPGKII